MYIFWNQQNVYNLFNFSSQGNIATFPFTILKLQIYICTYILYFAISKLFQIKFYLLIQMYWFSSVVHFVYLAHVYKVTIKLTLQQKASWKSWCCHISVCSFEIVKHILQSADYFWLNIIYWPGYKCTCTALLYLYCFVILVQLCCTCKPCTFLCTPHWWWLVCVPWVWYIGGWRV